jgi:hypothetical protein
MTYRLCVHIKWFFFFTYHIVRFDGLEAISKSGKKYDTQLQNMTYHVYAEAQSISYLSQIDYIRRSVYVCMYVVSNPLFACHEHIEEKI